MKKIVSIIVLLLVAGGIYFFTQSPSQPTQSQTESPIQSRRTASQSNEVKQSPVPNSAPSRLAIEAIGVDAAIESVGMNEKGEMAVPQEDMNVAWYNLGYKPGEQGSAVIAGHFDTKAGGPAVFYNLQDLSPGDEITVTYPTGEKFTFAITDSALYPYNDFPLERVFNTTGEATLNLITCDGVFDSSARNYSQRRVVYAALKNN